MRNDGTATELRVDPIGASKWRAPEESFEEAQKRREAADIATHEAVPEDQQTVEVAKLAGPVTVQELIFSE